MVLRHDERLVTRLAAARAVSRVSGPRAAHRGVDAAAVVTARLPSQAVVVEPVPKLPQGPGSGGSERAGRDSGGANDLSVRWGMVGEQRPQQGPLAGVTTPRRGPTAVRAASASAA
jgi:hypothetical protein